MSSLANVSVRQRMVTAASAAGLVFAILLLQHALTVSMQLGTMWPSDIPRYLGFTAVAIVAMYVPLAVGVFLWHWLLAPIAPELGFWQVLARSLLAVAAGWVLLVVVSLVLGMVNRLSGVSWFGDSITGLDSAFASAADYALTSGLTQSLITAIDAAPVVVLAGVCLWLWLTKHQAQQPAEGVLDEV